MLQGCHSLSQKKNCLEASRVFFSKSLKKVFNLLRKLLIRHFSFIILKFIEILLHNKRKNTLKYKFTTGKFNLYFNYLGYKNNLSSK